MILALPVVRLLLAVGLAAFALGAWYLVRTLVLRRATTAAGVMSPLAPGLPGVLFFTTPQCAACKNVQRPVLQDLAVKMAGKIQVVEIDATERPDLARSWSVLSVPTTFVVDAEGRPRHVNHGVTSARKLLQQLALAR